jgi:hypothetical protein
VGTSDTVLPTPDIPEPPRTCVGCGHTIRHTGVWVDETGRGHCTALPDGHRPSLAGTPTGGAR